MKEFLLSVIPLSVVLVSGYALSITWGYSRWQLVREDRQQVFFRSIFYGVSLFVIALLFQIYLDICDIGIIRSSIGWNSIKEIFNIENLDTGYKFLIETIFLCLLLGTVIGHIFNYSIYIIAPRQSFRSKIRTFFMSMLVKRSSHIEKLIFRYMSEEDLMVLVCLDNGKIYIGYITNNTHSHEKTPFISILTLLSGYRKEGREKIVITRFYRDNFDKRKMDYNKDQLGLEIPLCKITSLTLCRDDMLDQILDDQASESKESTRKAGGFGCP